MTKNRQKRFSNGKTQFQKKTLTLKALKESKQSQGIRLSLEEAYEIVGGYRQINAKSEEARAFIYKRAFEMVQNDDADFAKLLKEDKVKPNKKVQRSLELTRAYNIVGGFEIVDKTTFKQAIELLKADQSDPEFAALLIKFAESHTSFKDADDETLAKIDEEGLAFFANKVNPQQVVDEVKASSTVQEAFEATPSVLDTENVEEQEKAKEAVQISIIQAAITDIAEDTIENGVSDQPFEERVEEQARARVIALRLEEINEDREEAAIVAIKTNSEKPLTKFRNKMRDAFNFKKHINISVPNVSKMCEGAAKSWNKFTQNLQKSTENSSAKIKVLANKARSKAAIFLAGLMLTSTVLTSCGNKQQTQDGITYSQEQVDSIKNSAAQEAVANYIAEQQRQRAAEQAAAEAQAAEQARRDSILNMTVPHEWNDSTMRTIRNQADLDKVMNYYNQADSGRYDRMYRNLELIKDSLPTFQHNGDSVATKVGNEAVMKRMYQQLQFQYQTNDDGTTSVRDAYIAAQNLVQQLNRPCGDQEFQYVEGMKGDMQLLFDTPIPVMTNEGYTVVGQPYMSKEDCGEEVRTLGTRRVNKRVEATIDSTTIVTPNDSTINNDSISIALGVASNLTTIEQDSVVTNKVDVEVTKHKTSTRSDGSTIADDNQGTAPASDALNAGRNAQNNQNNVFVSNQRTARTVADSISSNPAGATNITLGVSASVRNDSSSVATNNITVTEHRTSTRSDGSVVTDEVKGQTTLASALNAGTNAQNNQSHVMVSDRVTTTNDSIKTDSIPSFTLGVSGAVRNDSTLTNPTIADSTVVSSVAADSVARNDFALKVDTIGWKILNPEDSIPVGTPSAWGEISGRGGWNFTSVTEQGIRDDKRYFGAESYDNSINVLTERKELFAFGQVFEGLTPQEAMRATRNLMQWSAMRNGNFAKFRKEALALDEFIKGKCKDSFTAEETIAIRDAFAAVHANGTIDNVIGRGGNHNATYTLSENCDELGRPTFTSTSTSRVTRPSGPYLERKYAMPITKPVLQLGVASNLTVQEVEETQLTAVDINLQKKKTSTNSAGETIAVTNKGEASVDEAIRAGNNAAADDGTVFVADAQHQKKMTRAERRALRAQRRAQDRAAQQQLRAGQQRLQYWAAQVTKVK